MVGKKSTTVSKRVQSQRRGIQDMSKNKPHYLPDGKLYKGDTHKAGATLMTGAKHSPSSKVLTHTPAKKVKK